MIVLGIILLLLAYLLPDFVPVPANVDHALTVVGWVVLVIGLVFAILSLFGRPIGGRHWY